jgi:hypothetical protein
MSGYMGIGDTNGTFYNHDGMQTLMSLLIFSPNLYLLACPPRGCLCVSISYLLVKGCAEISGPERFSGLPLDLCMSWKLLSQFTEFTVLSVFIQGLVALEFLLCF